LGVCFSWQRELHNARSTQSAETYQDSRGPGSHPRVDHGSGLAFQEERAPEGRASDEAMTELFLRLFDPENHKPSKKPARKQL